MTEASRILEDEVARSNQLQTEIHRMITQLEDAGFQNTDEYQSVLAAYQRLSHRIADATRDLRSRQAQEAQQARATGELMTQHDYSDIAPLKGTLGLPGRKGVVSKGPDIVNLQQFLTAAGFPVEATGSFDKATQNVLKQFQTRYGIHADGQVGAETRMLINGLIHGT